LPPRSGGPPSPSGMKFCHEILDIKLSCGENPKSLSRLVLKRYRVVTDGQTDRQTDRITTAITRYSYVSKERRKLSRH